MSPVRKVIACVEGGAEVSADDVLPELAQYGPVLTPAEVAGVMGVNRHHLVALMRDGKFPGFRLGGSWRVRRADVQAVMIGTWQPPVPVEEVDEED